MSKNKPRNTIFIITNSIPPVRHVDGVQYIDINQTPPHPSFEKMVGSDQITIMPISQSKDFSKLTIPNVARHDYDVIGYVVGCKRAFKSENSLKRMSARATNELRLNMFSAVLRAYNTPLTER